MELPRESACRADVGGSARYWRSGHTHLCGSGVGLFESQKTAVEGTEVAKLTSL